MALPSSGAISLSQVSTEAGYASNVTRSLGDSICRQLANISAGTISLSHLHGKAWLTQSDVVAWVSANRASVCQWTQGGSGDNRYSGNPYYRYVSSSSYTASFSLSGASLASSSWTTIVIVINGCSPSFTSYSINGGALGISNVNELYNYGEMRQRVLHVNTDFKNITSVAVTWAHANANRGSWATITVLPGKWTGWSNYGGNGVAIPAAAQSITIGGMYHGGYDANKNVTGAISAGCTYLNLNAHWYNNGTCLMVNNPTNSAASMGNVGYLTDNYGNITSYWNNYGTNYTVMSVA